MPLRSRMASTPESDAAFRLRFQNFMSSLSRATFGSGLRDQHASSRVNLYDTGKSSSLGVNSTREFCDYRRRRIRISIQMRSYP